MIETVVGGKKRLAVFAEVHQEFLDRCGLELPGTRTAAEIGMDPLLIARRS
jgi:hypothetical protein